MSKHEMTRAIDARWSVGQEPPATICKHGHDLPEQCPACVKESKPRPLCPDPVLGTRDGWAWCPDCGGIKEPGHGHGPALTDGDEVDWRRECGIAQEATAEEQRRSEFAESLLCAMALQHGIDKRDGETHAYGLPAVEWYPPCTLGDCVFCDAARGDE